jgi:hypothetical protein
MEQEFPIEEMKYGLIAIDKREYDGTEDGNVTILHFCGYKEKPTCNEITELRRELATEPDFGVMDIIEHVGIFDAPEWLVEEYRNDIISGKILRDNELPES